MSWLKKDSTKKAMFINQIVIEQIKKKYKTIELLAKTKSNK